MKRISNRVGKGGSTEANKRIQGNGGSKETKVVPRAAADFVWQLNISFKVTLQLDSEHATPKQLKPVLRKD